MRDTGETSKANDRRRRNIPLPCLAARFSELPKDKMIVAQCNTGVRAAMAWNILRENGFKCGWLNAGILIDPDGSWEIPED